MNKSAAEAMLTELDFHRHGLGDAKIRLEIFTVDGHMVCTKVYTDPGDALTYVEEEVKDRHKLTLAIK